MEIDIEKEVQARIDFKLNELKEALKQAANRSWHQALRSGSQKYSHYWEAFEQLERMLEKERVMAVPYNEMAIKNQREARDKAVDEIVQSLNLRRGDREFYHKSAVIANAVERAQKY